MLKSLELAFRGSSFQNFPGGEYPRTSLHRSHLQRSYVLPPNFEFVPMPLYYELYCTDHCIKWAFKTWEYRVSQNFKKLGKHISPDFLIFESVPLTFLNGLSPLSHKQCFIIFLKISAICMKMYKLISSLKMRFTLIRRDLTCSTLGTSSNKGCSMKCFFIHSCRSETSVIV